MSDLKEVVSVTINARKAQLLANIMANNGLIALLGGWKPKPLTRWERIRNSVNNFRCRVRDAWWVLTGKAEISYADDE